MIKAAFSYWENRIAPVFDIARQIKIVEIESGQIVGESQETFPNTLPSQKAMRLAELGVRTLVCGAISCFVFDLVEAYGIQVISFVAGDTSEVIHAWLNGRIDSEIFSMPGCGGQNRNRRRCIYGAQYGGNALLHKNKYFVKGGGRAGRGGG